jgi:hypothetical protein
MIDGFIAYIDRFTQDSRFPAADGKPVFSQNKQSGM